MGSPARNLDVLFNTAREASSNLVRIRDVARRGTVTTMRALEEQLRLALNGDTLRGLKDLVPGSDPHCLGAQLMKPGDIFMPLKPDAETLIVDKHGRFIVATMHPGERTFGDRGWFIRPMWRIRVVEDGDLRAEQLAPATSVIREVLERHIAATERTHATYAAAHRLGAKLARAIRP